jgi:hypothetical protein
MLPKEPILSGNLAREGKKQPQSPVIQTSVKLRPTHGFDEAIGLCLSGSGDHFRNDREFWQF